MRRGSSETGVAATPSHVWKTKFASDTGPLSVAGGLVFVPVIDEHRIAALDENTGRQVWSYTAGARVDTPPTIHSGMALFGSADGWAYCLRASDGVLVWKRRMAPAERFVGALGQLESAWPVHGSILVTDGTAYLSAGRSSYLDGGIHCFAIKPQTGEIIEQKTFYNPDPETGKMIHDPKDSHTMPGALSDILVSDGDSVWMRQEPVFGDGQSKNGPVYATGGFRDDAWFNRTTWAVGKATHAQLLVADDDNAYCIESFNSVNRGKPFTPGAKGYRLFALSLDGRAIRPEQQQVKAGGAGKKRKGKNATGGSSSVWSQHIPVRGAAMVLAGNRLVVVGAPDVVDPDDPLGAFEGRKGAALCVFAAGDGNKISEQHLDALPVFDGLAAANGRLFLSMQDGTVRCFR